MGGGGGGGGAGYRAHSESRLNVYITFWTGREAPFLPGTICEKKLGVETGNEAIFFLKFIWLRLSEMAIR